MKAGLKLINYDNLRNDLNTPTTQMSPYLKYGCISVREFFHKIKDKMGLDSALLRQLIWRDFYLHLMYCFPRVLNGKSLKPKYDNIVWENNTRLFNAWKRGKTGYPIIDANMRMLNETGYMHNRGRLIVSSFLVKLCLVDWRKGEKYFATKLIDYDPASNNGNWQWIAGSGADSQPYFRIFNPWAQSERHDTDAIFIKTWCPELTDVPAKHLHEWDKHYHEYKNNDYPSPVIDYKLQREKALALYKQYL